MVLPDRVWLAPVILNRGLTGEDRWLFVSISLLLTIEHLPLFYETCEAARFLLVSSGFSSRGVAAVNEHTTGGREWRKRQ